MNRGWRRPPVLVLHFDINKTILMADAVSGVGMDAMISSILSECSWGRAQKPADGIYSFQSWRLAFPTPTPIKPEEPDGDGLMTYNEYLEGIMKPDKALKRAAKAGFTKPGGVGEQLAGHHKRLREALMIPPELREAAAAALPTLRSGFYHLLPSFFYLINTLEAQGRKFHLVFRTFGSDIPEVTEEFNLFCRGAHPLFRPAVPSRTAQRAVTLPFHSGAIHRTSMGMDGVHLATVDDKQVVSMVHGLGKVYAHIMSRLSKDGQPSSMAIRDDFDFWAKHDESDDSGKLLPIEVLKVGCDEPDCHHIFFDDNIERDRPHIVDVRNVRTGAPVPFSGFHRSLDRFIVKAEPLEAVLDHEYYVKALEKAEDDLWLHWRYELFP